MDRRGDSRSGQVEARRDPMMSCQSRQAACGPPRPRLPADDRRSQILDAAFELFAERGFHGTKTRELARGAAVSEALVFHHFPTKEALIGAILDRVGLAGRIEAMEERFGTMPPRDGLVGLAEEVLTHLLERPHVFRVV